MLEGFKEVLTATLFIGGIITFISSLIQGYSGFGGGLLMVPLLAIIYTPIEGIAIAAAAGFIGSTMLVPSALKNINWKETAPITIGMSLSIPLGLIFLTAADPGLIRTGMGLFILVAGLLMLSGWTYKGVRNSFTSYIAGTFAGVVTGGFGIPGGPFAVIYLISSNLSPRIQRANIIFTVGVGMCFLICGLTITGSYSEQTIARSIILTPTFVIGNVLGKQLFKLAPLNWFNKVTNILLILIALIILVGKFV